MTSDDESIVKTDTFVEFKSQLGNTIVHPSQWSVDDKGDAFSLASPDGHATINVLTFAVEGSGTLTDFQKTVVSGIEGAWRDSEWTDIDIGGVTGKKRELTSTDDNAEDAWRAYVHRQGDCYHAVLVHASLPAMQLNGGFYEKIVRSFQGISKVP